MQIVEVNESSLEHTLNVVYIGFENGGDLMGQCFACHSSDYFDDPAIANKWNDSGYDLLVEQILNMKVAEHCDVTCAKSIADYLFDEVWDKYLNVEEAFGNAKSDC